jgi:hypothetical protein
MIAAEQRMKPFADDRAIAHHNRTDQRVWCYVACASPCKLERSPHEARVFIMRRHR